MAGKQSSGKRWSLRKTVIQPAQQGAENGTKQGIYLAAFGAAVAGVLMLWDWAKRRMQP